MYYKVRDGLSRIIHRSFIYKDAVGYVYRGMEGFAKWIEGKYTDRTPEEKVAIVEKGLRLHEEQKKNGIYEIAAGLESLKNIPRCILIQ